MARHNHGHGQGPQGQGGGGGGRRDFQQRDPRHNTRPPRGPQRPQRIEEELFDDEPDDLQDMDATETEIATYLTIRAQNIELLGLASKIAGCHDPKSLINDVDAEATMRRLHEIYSTLEEWVDPDEADEDVE
jgi:hypothetical protein